MTVAARSAGILEHIHGKMAFLPSRICQGRGGTDPRAGCRRQCLISPTLLQRAMCCRLQRCTLCRGAFVCITANRTSLPELRDLSGDTATRRLCVRYTKPPWLKISKFFNPQKTLEKLNEKRKRKLRSRSMYINHRASIILCPLHPSSPPRVTSCRPSRLSTKSEDLVYSLDWSRWRKRRYAEKLLLSMAASVHTLSTSKLETLHPPRRVLEQVSSRVTRKSIELVEL